MPKIAFPQKGRRVAKVPAAVEQARNWGRSRHRGGGAAKVSQLKREAEACGKPGNALRPGRAHGWDHSATLWPTLPFHSQQSGEIELRSSRRNTDRKRSSSPAAR